MLPLSWAREAYPSDATGFWYCRSDRWGCPLLSELGRRYDTTFHLTAVPWFYRTMVHATRHQMCCGQALAPVAWRLAGPFTEPRVHAVLPPSPHAVEQVAQVGSYEEGIRRVAIDTRVCSHGGNGGPVVLFEPLIQLRRHPRLPGERERERHVQPEGELVKIKARPSGGGVGLCKALQQLRAILAYDRPPGREEAHVDVLCHLLYLEVGPVDQPAVERTRGVAPPVCVVNVQVGVADGDIVRVRRQVRLREGRDMCVYERCTSV